ncbi:hypothetical protein ACYCVF_35710 [Bradyrhizobium sp. 1.29L]
MARLVPLSKIERERASHRPAELSPPQFPGKRQHHKIVRNTGVRSCDDEERLGQEVVIGHIIIFKQTFTQ